MMKKVKNKIGYSAGIACFCFLMASLSGCRDEIIVDGNTPPVDGSDKEVPIVINLNNLSNPQTYGVTDWPGDLTKGAGKEELVKNVTVFIFDNLYNLDTIVYSDVPANKTDVGPVMVKVGAKQMIVVANANIGIKDNSTFWNDDNLKRPNILTEFEIDKPISFNTLRQQIIVAQSALPDSCFLMTGDTTNAYISKDTPSKGYHELPIGLNRAVAKMKLKICTDFGTQYFGTAINMQSVILHRGASSVELFRPDNSTDFTVSPTTIFKNLNSDPTKIGNTFDEYDDQSKTITSGKTLVPAFSSNKYCMMSDSIYTYENIRGKDTANATWIELKAKVNGTTDRTAKFYLGERKIGNDTVYNVDRNYWYNVTVKILKPGLDSIHVTMTASHWNVADPIDTVAGGGFQATTAQPFKLVKYYEDDKVSAWLEKDTAKIVNHSKGGSWIDLQVTNGVSWKLYADGDAGTYFFMKGKTAWTKNHDTKPYAFSGTGGDTIQRIYIYRPYKWNNEPKTGPKIKLEVDGTQVRTFVLQPRDSLIFPTNSYILRPAKTGTPYNESHAYIPLKHVYDYWENFLDTAITKNAATTTKILWKDRDNTQLIISSANMNVINAGKLDSAYLDVLAGKDRGNAVVSVEADTTIIWSYHIWVTEYNPYKAAGQKYYQGNEKNVFMDRNLGAMGNTFDTEGNARGLFYQWGRKDPFPRSKEWENTPSPQWWSGSGQIPMPLLLPSSLDSPRIAVISNPQLFYDNASFSVGQYYYPGHTWERQSGSDKKKTAFDPCPEGWCVPFASTTTNSGSPWKDINNLIGFNYGQLPDYDQGYYQGEVGYYPLAGCINVSNGVVYNTTSGYYRASQVITGGNNSTGLQLNATLPIILAGFDRWYGASVRCVVDKDYLEKTGGGLFGTEGPQLIDKIK